MKKKETALTPTPPPPPIKSLGSKVAILGYLFLCLNALLLSYLLVADPWSYDVLTKEDCWIENLTAILFFLASLLLVATALAERSTFRRCVYALGAIVMVFVAGEEISWGQRILGFATPDFLLNLNTQREFNLHNIGPKTHALYQKIFWYGSLILCTVTSAAFFCRRYAFFRIPLPSILLMFGFLVGVAHTGETHGIMNLLLLFGIYTLLARQVQWLIATVASVTLILALLYVKSMFSNSMFISSARFEAQEYLFGIACLFYALELWLAQRRTTTISRASHQTPVKERSNSPSNSPDIGPTKVFLVPSWLAVCSFVVVCSIGLVTFQFFKARAMAAEVEEIYQSIVSGRYGKPLIRSTFDAYLTDNQLIYFKEPCSEEDIKQKFFLHLIPADEKNLPDHRKWYGFDILSFYFGFYNLGLFDGKCITKVPLPDYTIDRIRTGQYVSGKGQLWKAEASFP